MIDVERLVRDRIGELRLNRPVLAASFDLPPHLCGRLWREGLIAGFVASSAKEAAFAGDAAAGHWIDRAGGHWLLRPAGAGDVLYLGNRPDLHGSEVAVRSMERAAAGAGIARIHVSAGAQTRTIVPESNRLGRLTAMARRVLRPARGTPSNREAFDAAFEDLLAAAGDRLRLPPEAFESGAASLVIGSLSPGGAERQAATTACGLAGMGRWRPVVSVLNTDEGVSSFHRARVEGAGARVDLVPTTPAEFAEPEYQALLDVARRHDAVGFQNVAHIILAYAAYFRRVRPQLTQCWMDYCNVLAGLGAHLAGVPALVLSGRSLAPDNFEIFQPYMRPGYRALLAARDVVFTNNSLAGAQDYARWLDLPLDRFRIVHNGFEFPDEPVAARSAALRADLGVPAGAPVMGTISRFSEEKRPDLWVATAEQILRARPDAYCVAFGSGVMWQDIADGVRRRGLDDRLKLPGVTKDAWAAIGMMDVFVLTSRLEGLPNVLVEAQGMGVPVVTPGKGGMTETYVERVTGMTSIEDTPESLAQAVLDLLADGEKRARAGEAARGHARAEFAVDRMLDGTLRVFDEAVAAGARG